MKRGSARSSSILRRTRLTSVSTLRSVTCVSPPHTRCTSASRLNTMPGLLASRYNKSNSCAVNSMSRPSSLASRRAGSTSTPCTETALAWLPAQQGANPCDQLADAERLRQVIVRPALEPEYLVGLFPPSREHQDRDVP